LVADKYAEIIKKYLTGTITLKQLREIIEERLFELRETFGEVSDEEDFLSGIELFIEEVKDGFRAKEDFIEYLKSLVPEPNFVVFEVNAVECRETKTRLTVISGASTANAKFTGFISPDFKFQMQPVA
jgi:hypothetical protein